jgi:hypothetical protein
VRSHSLLRVLVWCLALGSSDCKSRVAPAESKVVSAQFGLFFGGQIQQRLELPFELDSTRQTQGFHLKFREPVRQPTQIEWTLDYPTARTGPRGPSNAPRAERTERATLPVGADRFEQSLTLQPTDLPGTYNLRICVDEEIVMDRPFLLVNKRLGEYD